MHLKATGNASFGYFGGGQTPSAVSTVDRVDYANDTATASPKGPLSSVLDQMGATSSRANAIPLKGPGVLDVPVSFGAFSLSAPQGTDFGFFGGGGFPLYSTVDRVDFSNDTATALSRGPLSVDKYTHGATRRAS